MASTSKCPYCQGIVMSNERCCPNCGASNLDFVEDTERTILSPKTIEELKEYCAERGMPLYRMRFFIGEDFKEPKAFGIYKKDNGTVVVYKNKADGSRAVRYEGPDEEKGVTEIYLKLLDECHRRGIYPETPDGKPPKNYQEEEKKEKVSKFEIAMAWAKIIIGFLIFKVSISSGAILLTAIFCAVLFYFGWKTIKNGTENKKQFWICVAVMCVILLIPIGLSYKQYKHPTGYYQTDSGTYYHLNDAWFYLNDYGRWTSVSEQDFGRTEYVGTTWDSDWGSTEYDFKDSECYKNYVESQNSSHSDYDSWDAGDTDWDSDW